MSFPQQPIHTRVALDPAPESEPELEELTTPAWQHKLFVPADWSQERKRSWLEFWMKW